MAIYTTRQEAPVIKNTPHEIEQAVEKIAAQKNITPKPIPKSRDSRFETETKKRVSIWLDKAVIERAREGGPGWQGRLNEFLIRHFK